MEGGETDRCVIGTLNASAMNSERLATYLGLAEDTGVDVLCVQETRMAPMGFQGAAKAARLAGWHAWFVAGGIDAQGNQTHGLATFSRWPARRVKSSPGTPHQALAVILDIPERPPVVVYNHYGDPRCGATRDEQVLPDARRIHHHRPCHQGHRGGGGPCAWERRG